MEISIIILLSYLSGSVPFGLILTKIFTNKDIRSIGSGNIGATNVLRTGNKYLAMLVLILDSIKGFLPVAMTSHIAPDQIQISALMVFLGHIFPIWLKFRGGKGVATYLGVLFALSLSLSILFIFTWMIVSLIFKYSSVSSMFSSLTLLVVNIFRDNVIMATNPSMMPDIDIKSLLFIFFVLIIFTHRKNISNLKNGTEKKIKI
jgi:acyl phosphate:glycerol-3-phosphate acyltransferase